MRHVELDSSLRNEERFGNLLVCHASHEESKDLPLASRQRMSRLEPGLLQGLRVPHKRRQDFGRYPILSVQDAADRLRQFRPPRFRQFHKPVYTPMEKSNFVRIIAVCRWNKRKKFAAR